MGEGDAAGGEDSSWYNRSEYLASEPSDPQLRPNASKLDWAKAVKSDAPSKEAVETIREVARRWFDGLTLRTEQDFVDFQKKLKQ